jgi:hypothetical protein
MTVKPTIELLFEPRDLRIGLYWIREDGFVNPRITLYLCLIPCLLIKLSLPTKQDYPFDVEIELNLNAPQAFVLNCVKLFCPVKEQYSTYDNRAFLTFRQPEIAEHFAWLLMAWGYNVSKPTMSFPF